MMSKADNMAKTLCDAMVLEHAKRVEYFHCLRPRKLPTFTEAWVADQHLRPVLVPAPHGGVCGLILMVSYCRHKNRAFLGGLKHVSFIFIC